MSNLTNIDIIKGKFSRFYCYNEDLLEFFLSQLESYGFGMGTATILLAFGIRIAFLPYQIINYKSIAKNKLISADIKDFTIRLKRLKKVNQRNLMIEENNKLINFQAKHGISGNILKVIFSVGQGIIFLVWSGLVQKFSYNLEDYPNMITGGFLWFKDLSLSDPYFILPLLHAICLGYSLHANSMVGSENMVKMRRYLIIMPFFSFTMFTSFQSGMLIYFCASSFFQASFLFFMRSKAGMKLFKISNEYLPDTKLEKVVSKI